MCTSHKRTVLPRNKPKAEQNTAVTGAGCWQQARDPEIAVAVVSSSDLTLGVTKASVRDLSFSCFGWAGIPLCQETGNKTVD